MKNFNLDAILEAMLKTAERVSDLNFSVGRPPQVEVDGQLVGVNFPGLSRLTPFQTEIIALHMLRGDRELTRTLLQNGSADLSYSIPGKTRFRVNIFSQRGTYAIVLRVIPEGIPTLEKLGMPAELHNVAKLKNGIVLVTGPTGSGKSTTLAAIIDLINETRSLHVITIEDPIEFVHPNKKCLIHQREIGTHAKSFAEALKAAGREDPDLILVGEMRDLDTISMALSAAERGTLVFGTLHTNNAAKTMDRIISVFPAPEQEGIRTVLGETIRAVVAQQLLPQLGGGRVAALEILFSSPAIGNMIREGKTPQITSAIQTGMREGMIDMDSSIRKLYDAKRISARAAYDKAIDKEQFKDLEGI